MTLEWVREKAAAFSRSLPAYLEENPDPAWFCQRGDTGVRGNRERESHILVPSGSLWRHRCQQTRQAAPGTTHVVLFPISGSHFFLCSLIHSFLIQALVTTAL